MEMTNAIASLAALAHETRLEAFRLLVRTSPDALAAGEIAERLGVAPPTLSFHLSQLVRADLVDSRREGRSILYSLRVDGIRALLHFVTEDCCQGRPELCAPDTQTPVDCGECC